MKKTIFALFAVVLVLSLATCDLLDESLARGVDDSLVPDGMASLSINIEGAGAIRALNTSQATDSTYGVDYYEVVFTLDGTNFYQAEFGTSGLPTAKIKIPIGNYGGTTGKAVMFAGINGTDKILLAVGIISKLTDGTGDTAITPGANAQISTSTTGVTFKLTALKSAVNNNKDGANVSSFLITSTNYSSATIGIQTLNTAPNYPVFPVPPAGDSEVATGHYSIDIANYAGVYLSSWSTAKTAYTADSPYSGITTPVLAETSLTTAGLLSASPEFTFTINVSSLTPTTGNGLCQVSIDATVYPLSPTAKKTFTAAASALNSWHIYGGIDKSKPDGIANGNGIVDGGAVILAVGEYNFAEPALIVDPSVN